VADVGVAVIGMAVILVAFLVAVFVFRNVNKPAGVIVAVLGPIGTAVGTLAGFVAGAKVGSEGRDKAEDRADEAQRKYNAVVETNSPSIVDQARSTSQLIDVFHLGAAEQRRSPSS
jgi:hypothetical protein